MMGTKHTTKCKAKLRAMIATNRKKMSAKKAITTAFKAWRKGCSC